MSETKSTFKAKLIAIVASIALAMSMVVCVQPAHADTTFQNTLSTTSVQVKIGDSGTVQTVNFGGTGGVTIHSDRIGAMFNKSGYQVVGSNSYVTLQDVITAAGGTSTWDHVKFYVYNSKDGSYATYTKYNSGVFNREADEDRAGLEDSLPFYGDTTSTTRGSVATSYYGSGAVLALNGGTTAIPSAGTAATTLSSMSFNTSDAPRLMWGYDTVSNNEAGNRFPSNIVGITVYQAA